MPHREPRLREYVRSEDLAAFINRWLAADEGARSCQRLAEMAGCSMRAISKVLCGERRYQTIFLADRILTAMGRHLIELETEWRASSEAGEPKPSSLKAAA